MEQQNGQLLLIPNEPLRGSQKTIQISSIPENQTKSSRLPSASMRESVERFGVVVPILVTPLTTEDAEKFTRGGDPKFRLLCGRRRVLAAREVGHLLINAVVFPHGTTPTQAVTLTENEQRSENPLVELEAIEEILAAGGSLDDICEAVGMDKRRAESRMRLKALIAPLRAMLAENKLAVGVAEDAANLTEAEQTRLYNDAIEKNGGKIRGKDVDAVRRVRAADSAGNVLEEMFRQTDGDDTDRPVSVATGSLPTGLTVALNAPVAPRPFAVNSNDEAETACRSLIQWFDRAAHDPSGSEIGLMDALTIYLQAEACELTPTREKPQEAPQEAGAVIGATGKPIKPSSAARADRRRLAKAAQAAGEERAAAAAKINEIAESAKAAEKAEPGSGFPITADGGIYARNGQEVDPEPDTDEDGDSGAGEDIGEDTHTIDDFIGSEGKIIAEMGNAGGESPVIPAALQESFLSSFDSSETAEVGAHIDALTKHEAAITDLLSGMDDPFAEKEDSKQ